MSKEGRVMRNKQGLYWGGEASVTQVQTEKEKRRKKKEKYSDQREGGICMVARVHYDQGVQAREYSKRRRTRSSTERHDEDIRGFKPESLLRIIIIELKAVKEDFVT